MSDVDYEKMNRLTRDYPTASDYTSLEHNYDLEETGSPKCVIINKITSQFHGLYLHFVQLNICKVTLLRCKVEIIVTYVGSIDEY